jgi:hypothetical protein
VHVHAVHPDGSRVRLRASTRADRYKFGITKMKGMAGRHLALQLDITADRAFD